MRTNFNMTDENITMVCGDTLSFNTTIKDENGDPVTVSAANFTIKQTLDSRVNPQVNKTLGDGITQDDGVLTVRLAPADTATLYPGLYYYDFQITVDSTDRYTLLRGIISLEADV